jgi:hypothetical protein
VPLIEVCKERRGAFDFVWSEEDTRRLSCNVDAVGDAIWGLSFDDCVADAEACVAAAEEEIAEPVWECETLAADAMITEAQRGEANALLDQCYAEWQAFFDGLKNTASCEALVESPWAIPTAAATITLLVSAPGLVQPPSCREFSEKYGSKGGGGGGDWD